MRFLHRDWNLFVCLVMQAFCFGQQSSSKRSYKRRKIPTNSSHATKPSRSSLRWQCVRSFDLLFAQAILYTSKYACLYTHKLKCMQNKQIQVVSERTLLMTAVQLLMSAKQHYLIHLTPTNWQLFAYAFLLIFVCVWICSYALYWICLLKLFIPIFSVRMYKCVRV